MPLNQIPAERSIKRSPLTLWLWTTVLIAAAAGAWFLQPWQTRAQPTRSKGSQEQIMAVAVAASIAHRGNMPVYFDGLGSVLAYYTVTVRSRVDGELTAVYFREGQNIRQGEVLAEIDPRPFQVQLEQAEGQMARDQATLENAKVDLDRYQGLVAEDAVPKQQLDTQAALVKQLEGALKVDQAAIDNARLQLVYCRIVAPIEGRIGLRLVDPGNIVHASDPNGLLVITEMRPITVLFTLPEDSLPPVLGKLRGGVLLAVEAYNRDKSQKLASGRLLTVDNQIDQNTGTTRLKAVFENEEGTLFPNQFVNVRLLVDVLRGKVLVPSVAIQRGAQGTYVYVVKADNTVEFRLVEAGINEGNLTVVNQGLKVGERVITDGADKLQPGSRVSVKPENAAPPGLIPARRGGG
jgi:membrane fusion protein, multidrug efflux system